MPDQAMTVSTWPDVGPTSETPNSGYKKPEVEITLARKKLAKRFQRLPHIFDLV